MITRIITLMLIAILALPSATLIPTSESGQAPWTESAVAAKGKKQHKQKDKKKGQQHGTQTGTAPQTTTVTRTERQTVTQTFASTQQLIVPAGGSGPIKGAANPYPSTIAVSGLSDGVITDVNLILSDLTHAFPDDIDILLSRGDGRQAFVMSDRGGEDDVLLVDLTLDDEAATQLPDNDQLTSGTFRPINTSSDADDIFPAPVPAPDGTVALSAFDGTDPNGSWHLWVNDDGFGDFGTIGGWALEITAEVDVQLQEQVSSGQDETTGTKTTKKGPKDKKRKKGRK